MNPADTEIEVKERTTLRKILGSKIIKQGMYNNDEKLYLKKNN